ncbi:hypothetical protein EC973_007663 [Apophysomyces ossiformis]|uniref:Uncharacterized protein n=1 Tax=Apophysomyces ossiformis TaxID=679940 RepID=A0A8H7BPJ0_9FUNG|nr:hypothetical protein EC973_007663 [Apophysomyces ossiformis]
MVFDGTQGNYALRTRKYKVEEVNENSLSVDDDSKWNVGSINVSDTLFMFREQTIKRNNNYERLSDLEMMQTSISSWRDIKLATIPMLVEAAGSTNEDDLLAAEIIYNLAGRLLDDCNEKRMLEDSFAHKYLDVILETVFGSDKRFKHDWANGSLPGSKRKRQQCDSNADNEGADDDDDDDTDGDGNDPQGNAFKPDWVVYTKTWKAKATLGVMELKVAHKKNPGYITDFVKIAKEMKMTINEMVCQGVDHPVVCGILVEGFHCRTFAMDLSHSGIYRMIAFKRFKLCRSIQEMVLFPAMFENILHLKRLAVQTALAVEKCGINRQLGKKLERQTPLSWIRPMTGSVKRL